MVRLRYFSSQQAIKASLSEMAVKANTSMVPFQSFLAVAEAMEAMPIQCPPGVIFLVANMTCPFTFIL